MVCNVQISEQAYKSQLWQADSEILEKEKKKKKKNVLVCSQIPVYINVFK